MKHPHVVHLEEVETRTQSNGRFGSRSKWLGHAAGGKGIGCSWYEIDPGKTTFPYHYHCANEESLFVLEGTGRLRLGEEEIPIGPGDYVVFPTGPESAHQLTATGDRPLRYLCLSTLNPVDIVGYPDSNKFMFTSRPEGKPPLTRRIFDSPSVDYYAGEKT